jgi:hypothetical protein
MIKGYFFNVNSLVFLSLAGYAAGLLKIVYAAL